MVTPLLSDTARPLLVPTRDLVEGTIDMKSSIVAVYRIKESARNVEGALQELQFADAPNMPDRMKYRIYSGSCSHGPQDDGNDHCVFLTWSLNCIRLIEDAVITLFNLHDGIDFEKLKRGCFNYS